MSADQTATPVTDARLDEIRDRWSQTTQGPWFWWGNTDSGNEALCGRQPGLGVCEVLSTIDIERTANDPGAREYREFLSDGTWSQPDGSFRHLTDEELDEKVREDWLTDSWDQPRSDRKLALTNENHIRRAVSEVAVYQVARAQGMPDDTPRTDSHVYRADICDVRNPNGRALAASWSDVRDLLAEVDRLRALLTAQTNTTEVAA